MDKNIRKHKNFSKILVAYILTALLLGSVFTFAVSTVTACISSVNGGNCSIVDGNEPVCVNDYTATPVCDVDASLLEHIDGIGGGKQDNEPPSPITGLTATDAGIGGTVNLAWNANADSDFAYYNIYQNTSTIADVTGMTPINNSITNNATNTYQVTGLTDGTTYYFAITAIDNNENENKTVTDASATPTTVPAITSVTHDATGSLKTGSVLTVTLNGDQGLTATFDVGSVGKWQPMTEGTGANKGKYTGSYIVQNGDDGAWTVTGHLNSTGTASMDATPNIAVDTAAPTISSVQSSSVTDTTATISWTTNEDSDSLIEYGTTVSYGSTKSDAAMVTSHSIQLTGLTASTLYHYRVKSADSADNLATSTDYTFTTVAEPDTTAPAAISNLAATASTTSGATMVLTWSTPGDDGSTGTATSYDIRFSTVIIDTDTKFNSATQCTDEPAPKAAGGSEVFDVTGLTEGTTYYFAIKT
ncbi:hypothetical protein FP804_04635, partial [archaeon]|nr:hypothetical protein [archaeon]